METPRTGRSKLLWGCGGGCVTFLAILAVFAWLARWWMMQPMPVAEPRVFVGPQTRAVLIVYAEPGDELMLRTLAEVAGTEPSRGLLAPGTAGEEGLMKSEAMAGVAPVQVVAVLGVPGAQADSAGLVVSLRRGGRAFVQSTGSYYAGRYGPPEEGPNAAVYGADAGPYAVTPDGTNTVMISTTRKAAQSWALLFDRRWQALQDGESASARHSLEGAGAELEQELEGLEPGAPVRAGAVGRPAIERIATALAGAADEERAPLVRQALVGVTAVSAQLIPRDESSAALTVHLAAADPDGAGAAVEAALDAYGAASIFVRPGGDGRVRVEAIIPDVPAAAAELVRALSTE